MNMKRIILAIIAFILVSAAVIGGIFFNEFYLKRPLPGAVEKNFVIEKDSAVRKISSDLLADGLINNSFIFESYVWLARADRQFRAGNFKVLPGMSIYSLTKLLTVGGGRDEVEITIVPGWALRDIKKYLVEQNVKGMESFDSLAGRSGEARGLEFDWTREFAFLADKPKSANLEGYLFPDTYRIFKEASAEDAVRKILQNFDDKFDKEMRALAGKLGMSIFEVVNLASIVEREVRSEEDMKLVADIFLRRQGLGMPLQADSTVNYVTEADTPAISFADRDIDSPWNTYKYRGLPKGPISNPGFTALKAVLNSEPNPYLYFLTTKEGEVIYSRTLEEHNRAKAKYLK